MVFTRLATHAGSWYKSDGSDLRKQLDTWMKNVSPSNYPARAIISPHAGYSYCGDCAAHAYKQINPDQIDRIFILGPSHHVSSSTCMLSSAETYQTPLYDLIIDTKLNQDLAQSGMFEFMNKGVDEDEHSIEMQLPYIARVMEKKAGRFTIVPIMVGALSSQREVDFGALLAKFLLDPRNLFVISSDFCHWGSRFRYERYEGSHGDIHHYIDYLDHMGMQAIESLSHAAFADYLAETRNTICGRHPIGVLLAMIENIRRHSNGRVMQLRFLKYSQSSKVRSRSDSSVSYAAASFVIGD